MIKSMENLLRSNVTNVIMKEVSSLVTCGTSVNTGHNNGLWKIFKIIDWRSSASQKLLYLQYGTVHLSQVWHGRQQAIKYHKLKIC